MGESCTAPARVGVVGGGGRAPGFTPISSFYNPFLDLASEVPWPRHYHPRHLFAQAQSLPREINSYQGLWFRPSRCIMLSEICGVVQGEFQGGGTPRSTPQVAVSDCAARHGFVLFRLLWRPVTTPSWLSRTHLKRVKRPLLTPQTMSWVKWWRTGAPCERAARARGRAAK